MNLFTSSKAFPPFGFFILLLLLSRTESRQIIRCRAKEREALLLFKEGLTDDNGILSSWQTDDCCDWEGVRCSNQTNHVVSLVLPYFSGKLHPSLLELQHLTYLDLSSFYSPGNDIPEFIGSLTRLRYLNLSSSGLEGMIPDQLGNLSNLHYLDLSGSSSLAVQNLNWISHLSSLRYLDLSWANLSKAYDWPQAVSKLPLLTVLKLSNCRLPTSALTSIPLFNFSMSFTILDLSYNYFGIELSKIQGFYNYSQLTSIQLQANWLFGPISEDFGRLKSLKYLNMGSNMLEGGITNSIGNLSNLEFLDLSNNRLNETIHPSFGKLQKLTVLDLQDNKFQGALSDFLTSLLSTELEYLDISSNLFTGLVSEVHLQTLFKLKIFHLSYNSLILKFNNSDWVPPFNLTSIGLANCKIGPYFPSWLQTQRYLESIDVSSSGIDDHLPKWFGDTSSQLSFLNMSNNHIRGFLPDLSIKSLDRLGVIDLSSCNIEGPIPKFPPNVLFLYLSRNKFRNSLVSLCNLTSSLEYLDLSHNLLSGKIPDCLMQLNLALLNLGNNNFSGSIPSSIGQLTQIHSLHLRNNRLEGELPTSLKQCKELRMVDVSQNKLRGEIPSWLGRKLQNLLILSLRSNQFNGAIPSDMCYLKTLQILDLSNNNISGTIPNCLRHLTAMAQKGSSDLTDLAPPDASWWFIEEATSLMWKGIELEYRNTLGLVKYIDISSNNLTGEIPSEITDLEGLVALNISRNNLNGNIPPEIGYLQHLEYLDLSRNHLSGTIPRSLSQLYYIGVLDLSNNNLSGRIPSSTQLQSFKASSYSGNPGLCGLPLPKLCPEDERNFSPRGNQDLKDEGAEKLVSTSFYTALGTGFAAGLCGVLGSLLVNASWRIAYFSFVSNVQDTLYVAIVLRTAKLKRFLKK